MNKIVAAIGLVSLGAAVFGAVSTIGNRLYDKLEADYAKESHDNWSKAWDMAYKLGREKIYMEVEAAANNGWLMTIEPIENYKRKVKVTYAD